MNHHYDNKSKGELSDSFDSSFCPYCNKNHIVKFGKDKKAHLLQLLIRYLAILKKNVIIEQYRIIMNLKCQLKYKDFELTVFVRNPAKYGDMDLSNVKVIQADALDANAVEKAMEGQDTLLCSLEGDVLTMAKNIVAALEKTSVKRIIWITGMEIYHEIKGARGIILNMLVKLLQHFYVAQELKVEIT